MLKETTNAGTIEIRNMIVSLRFIHTLGHINLKVWLSGSPSSFWGCLIAPFYCHTNKIKTKKSPTSSSFGLYSNVIKKPHHLFGGEGGGGLKKRTLLPSSISGKNGLKTNELTFHGLIKHLLKMSYDLRLIKPIKRMSVQFKRIFFIVFRTVWSCNINKASL